MENSHIAIATFVPRDATRLLHYSFRHQSQNTTEENLRNLLFHAAVTLAHDETYEKRWREARLRVVSLSVGPVTEKGFEVKVVFVVMGVWATDEYVERSLRIAWNANMANGNYDNYQHCTYTYSWNVHEWNLQSLAICGMSNAGQIVKVRRDEYRRQKAIAS